MNKFKQNNGLSKIIILSWGILLLASFLVVGGALCSRWMGYH